MANAQYPRHCHARYIPHSYGLHSARERLLLAINTAIGSDTGIHRDRGFGVLVADAGNGVPFELRALLMGDKWGMRAWGV